MHVDRQLLPDMAARVRKARAVVKREIHRLGMQHFAPRAEIGHVTCRHDPADVLFGHLAAAKRDFTGKAVAARIGTGKACDHMIDADIGHLLRGLNSGADRAFGFLHGVDLAKADTARHGRCGPDDAELRLPRQRPEPVLAALFRAVEAQHEAGDLRCPHVQDGNHPALHRGAAHVPHGPLRLVEIRHCPETFV